MKTNLNFNSAICTSREQSERLLTLGLKKETADMHYYHTVDFEGNEVWYPSIIPYENVVMASNFVGETEICLENHTIPAWSLDRLIEMLKDSDTPENYKVDFHVGLNRYDEIIALIQSLIHIGMFNKEYLNNQQEISN
jgi:hypothetical protein